MAISHFARIEKSLIDVINVISEFKNSEKSISLCFDCGVKKTSKAYLKLIKLQLELVIDYIDFCLKFYY